MSGQRLQRLNSTPGQHSAIGSEVPAPSTRTATYQATAARYTDDGRGMAALGTALGSFFNAGAKTAETVAQVQHREEMVQVKRENEALSRQGGADHKLGKPMDPANADRRDYFEAYQTSAADAEAHRLSEGLREHLAAQRTDGSVDFAQAAEDFYRKEIGKGTGDPVYDARMLSQFSRAAESMVSQFSEARRSTVLQNSTGSMREEIARAIVAPEGIKGPHLSELTDRLLTVTHGNTEHRDKLLLSIIEGAVQNDAQGASVLTALQELGYEQREPEFYARVDEAILKQTNRVKSFEAGVAVQTWAHDLIAAKGNYPDGVIPMEKIVEFQDRAFAIDTAHGTGHAPFDALNTEFLRSVKRETSVNYFVSGFTGKFGTHDGGAIAVAHGKPESAVLRDGYEPGLAQVVEALAPSMPGLKDLAATKNALGLLEPMNTLASATAFARLNLTPEYRAAAMDTLSDRLKDVAGLPLLGRDANASFVSYSYYDTLRQGGMTADQLRRYFPSDDAANRFYAISGLANSPMGLRGAIKFLADNPIDAQKFATVHKTGKVNLSELAAQYGSSIRPQDFDGKVHKGRAKAILSAADRDGFFDGSDVGLDSAGIAQFDTLVAHQLMIQGATRGAVDVDAAIEQAGKVLAGKYLVVPGFNGIPQAFQDPFDGAGRHIKQPLNEAADHPLSISKGYEPIYAPGVRIVNAMNAEEDTLSTWNSDAKEAHKLFPGKIRPHADLLVGRPNKAGLSPVTDVAGTPIVFYPGEKVAFRTGAAPLIDVFRTSRSNKKGLESVDVPADPDDAAAFFREKLPKGWFAIATGGVYQLHYGFRVEVGQKELEQRIKTRGEFFKEMRERDNSADRPTVLPGGASLWYPNTQRQQ